MACGDGPSDYVMFPADSEESAERLATVLAQDIVARPRPWSLRLRNFSPRDLVIGRLDTLLDNARLVEGDISPMLLAEPATPSPTTSRAVTVEGCAGSATAWCVRSWIRWSTT